MKKEFLTKVIGAAMLIAAISTVTPLGVSAATIDNATQKASIEWNCGTNVNVGNSSAGIRRSGWNLINGTWYYLDKSGNAQTGWILDSGRKYFADSTGAMQTGVLKIDGKVYYFNKSGAMQTGRVIISGRIYRFASNGQATGTRIPTASKEFDSKGNLIINGSVNDNQGSTGNGDSNNNNNNNGTGNNGTDSNKPGDVIVPDDNGSNNTPENDNSATDKPVDGEENNKPEDNNSGSTGNGNTTTPENNSSTNVSGLPTLPETYKITIQNSAENTILQLMNQKRTEAGLKPLTMDNTLLSVARYKSNHMIQYNYFSHTNPDGTKWTNWLSKIGYKYNATAENIAYNSYDAVELFNQWWNSSGHRQNMMNPSYTKVGIGVVYGNGKYMGTQTFSN